MAGDVIVRHTFVSLLEDSEEAAAAGQLVPSNWNGDGAHVVEGAAPIDSPDFVGAPTAPTPDLGDTSRRLATMEALAAAIAHALSLVSVAIIPTTVTSGMSPYTPLATDQLLFVDTSVAGVVINLTGCAARNGVALEVKDATGNADIHPITVNRNGAELIDGATSVPLDSKFVAIKFAPKTAGGYAIV